MTDIQRTIAFSEAAHYKDKNAFVSDILLSSAFLPAEEDSELDQSLRPGLTRIWDVANLPVRHLLDVLDLSQTQCAERYAIPLRTIQHWCGGDRFPPPYVRLLLAIAEGYI